MHIHLRQSFGFLFVCLFVLRCNWQDIKIQLLTNQMFHFQLGPKKTVALNAIEEKWLDLALPKEQFDDLVRVGSFSGQVEWNRFFALAASALGDVSVLALCDRMLHVSQRISVCVI